MVEQANIALVQRLIGQRLGCRQALAIFDEGGGISAFVIQTPDDVLPAHQTWVEAAGIEYPAQMVDAIKQQLDAKLTAIEAELAALGVTALDTGPPFPSVARVR